MICDSRLALHSVLQLAVTSESRLTFARVAWSRWIIGVACLDDHLTGTTEEVGDIAQLEMPPRASAWSIRVMSDATKGRMNRGTSPRSGAARAQTCDGVLPVQLPNSSG